MKSVAMSAVEFRAEIKRLRLNQSSFAAATGTPLRTVQSWALGERSIPRTVRALIEKVEQMGTQDMLMAIAATLPKHKVKLLVKIATTIGALETTIRALEKRVKGREAGMQEMRAELAAMKTQLQRVQETCVFQANKLTAYEQDLRRRAAAVVPFNT
ncbi:MAG: hypothetical protein JO264_07260 [Acidisphaera sp.]|nr:hypothetical protein [Acidisphaera sp.]